MAMRSLPSSSSRATLNSVFSRCLSSLLNRYANALTATMLMRRFLMVSPSSGASSPPLMAAESRVRMMMRPMKAPAPRPPKA